MVAIRRKTLFKIVNIPYTASYVELPGLLLMEMAASIKIVLKGPPPDGVSSSLRYNTALPDAVFLHNLAATLDLRDQQQLDIVRFTSLGEAHSHASMEPELKGLLSDMTQGAELALEVVDGELRLQWQPCMLQILQTFCTTAHTPFKFAALHPASATVWAMDSTLASCLQE